MQLQQGAMPQGGSRRPRRFCRTRQRKSRLRFQPRRPCAQLTPSSASRARREHMHPKASKSGRAPALDPLENTIGRRRSSVGPARNVSKGEGKVKG
jgi:hypothetical protein